MWAGAAVGWLSRKQSLVTLSSAEAELYAAAEGFVFAENIKVLLQGVGVDIDVHMGLDNRAAIKLASQVERPSSWRTRHLRLRAAALKEKQMNQELTIHYVDSLRQGADVLTKTVGADTLQFLKKIIGVRMVLASCLVGAADGALPELVGGNWWTWLVEAWSLFASGYIWLDFTWWFVVIAVYIQLDQIGQMVFKVSMIEVKVALGEFLGIMLLTLVVAACLHTVAGVVWCMEWGFEQMLASITTTLAQAAQNDDVRFLQVVIYIIFILIGYEWMTSGITVVTASSTKEEDSTDDVGFETDTYWFSSTSLNFLFAGIGLGQFLKYMIGCAKALKVICRRWTTGTGTRLEMEPEQEPVA